MKAVVVLSILFVFLLSVASAESLADSVFDAPIKAPKEVNRTIYTPVGQTGLYFMSFLVSYEEKQVTEKIYDNAIFYPFNHQKLEELRTNGWDDDDLYVLRTFDTGSLQSCGASANSIEDVYECVRSFNLGLFADGLGNCRTSTSAFKIAFTASPLAKSNNSYKLMKAFVKDENDPFNAHRFVVLSNKNGHFVIDPYWGMFDDMNTSVIRNSDLFYDDSSSKNYRGLVYRIDYFFE